MTKAMQVALRFLTRREYSRHELTQKLRQQFSAAEVEQVVEDCCRRSLLSDQRFVESRVRHRVQQGYGPQWIHQDLRMHQLADELLVDALNVDEEFWIQQAIKLIDKKFGQVNLKLQQLKIQRYLHQKGYPFELIRQALKQLLVVND